MAPFQVRPNTLDCVSAVDKSAVHAQVPRLVDLIRLPYKVVRIDTSLGKIVAEMAGLQGGHGRLAKTENGNDARTTNGKNGSNQRGQLSPSSWTYIIFDCLITVLYLH